MRATSCPIHISKTVQKHEWRTIEKVSKRKHKAKNIKQYAHHATRYVCQFTLNSKNVKKRCIFFVVPGNGQALLGMTDMAPLNIINLNIDSIQVVTPECKTNRGQETHTSVENCTNKGTTRHKGCKNNNTGMQSINKTSMVEVTEAIQICKLTTSIHQIM